MELMEEIKELKEYKENKDLAIAELARRIEADDTTVGRWLKGGATPSCYSLHKVRRFLNSTKNSEDLKPLEPFREERERVKKDVDYLKQRIMPVVSCFTYSMECEDKDKALELIISVGHIVIICMAMLMVLSLEV